MPRIVATKGNGKCFSSADPMTVAPMPLDIVLVPAPPGPPVPTPCVNTADLGNATATVPTVFANDQEVVVKASQIPTSTGAPPTATIGQVSGQPVNNKCEFVTASATVFADGKPLVRHRDTTTQNAGNCPGGVKLKEALDLSRAGIKIDASLSAADKEAVVSALEELYATPRGKELIDSLQNPATMQGNQTTITTTTGGNTCGGLGSGSFSTPGAGGGPPTPGSGSNSTVEFNPNSTSVGGVGRPPALGMGHELIHALQAGMGIISRAIAGTRTPMAELQCIGMGPNSSDRLTDNALREERGLPTRNTHNYVDFFPYTPAPGSVPAKAFRMGAGGKGLVYAG
jgi:hypothetical protein